MRKIFVVLAAAALLTTSCSDNDKAAAPKGPDYCSEEKKVSVQFDAFGNALAAQFQPGSNPEQLRSATTQLQAAIASALPVVPDQIKDDYNALVTFLNQIATQLTAIDFDVSKAPPPLQQQLIGELPPTLQAAEDRVEQYDFDTCGIPKSTPLPTSS